MEINNLVEIIQNFIGGLPNEATQNLEDVEFLICENLEQVKKTEVFDDDPPETMKGCFVGSQLEHRGDDEYILPEGAIIIRADAIVDSDEAHLVLMHEIGHALGLSEEEVAAMGLGDEVESTEVDAKEVESEEIKENETSNQK